MGERTNEVGMTAACEQGPYSDGMNEHDQLREAAVLINRLRDAILDIDAHTRPLDEDESGFIAGGYLISIGSLHRALALTGTAPKCRECPHDSAHFTTAKKWNEPIPTGDQRKDQP